ncbi:hypothetical protein [Geobacillus subterraneus]|uniref:hypothetical protein n=1 Tax=Geobacillus subterraneus TaxID=129338 RepID=UPI001554165A|nr:hypothetical protein [Geobacillus subterraneus]
MKISKQKMAFLTISAGLSLAALTGCSSSQPKEDKEDKDSSIVVPMNHSNLKHSSKSSTENGIESRSSNNISSGKSGLGSGKSSAGS